MQNANNDPTNQDILETINEFSTNNDRRFDKLEEKVINLELGQNEIKSRLDNVAHRFELNDLDKRVTKLELKTNN
ncbi:MAG: hypothetical protein ABID45_01595 [Patescibacteria group bacterium]